MAHAYNPSTSESEVESLEGVGEYGKTGEKNVPGIRNVGSVALLVISEHGCLQGPLLPAIFSFLLWREEKWVSEGT